MYRFSALWKKADAPAFFEKAYRRAGLAEWEARWNALSVQSRDFFLSVVKGPNNSSSSYKSEPSVRISQFPPQVIEELKDGGFIELKASTPNSPSQRVFAAAGIYHFAKRVRLLHKFQVLDKGGSGDFLKYVFHNYFGGRLVDVINAVLTQAGVDRYVQLDRALSLYVTHRRWPEWVAARLQDPLAGQVLEVVQEAGGSIPLAELPARIKQSHPDEVRAITDKLVSHLALVEDLRPDTRELIVGLLPAVYEEMVLAAKPRERPPLAVCELPQEFAPDGGVMINDLRAVLLEVACEPPRLRQNRSLFQKEMERFEASLEPLPMWLSTALKWNVAGRVDQAIASASALRLVKTSSEGKRMRLRITPKGEDWLSGGIEPQYESIYEVLRAFGPRDDINSEHQGFTFTGMDLFHRYHSRGSRFLGEHAAVLKVGEPQFNALYGEIKTEDQIALREHLDRALNVLKPGVFYRLDSVASHVAFGEYNPLNRGLPLSQVTVEWAHQRIPPFEEERERAGRLLIETFVWRRLIPVGCVQAAVDDEGRICIAREPRYEAYFGREIIATDVGPNAMTTAKVVVQPDYTVVVIGVNAAPVAELVPFCERATPRSSGQGAMILKITRESVIKAVGNGLKAEEIAARLERHASNKVPANVLRQVRDWSTWVRGVGFSSVILIRCPDSDAADRVMAVLNNRSERVSDTLVAVKDEMLSSADRNKLKDHGIIAREE